jgi:hypothetical protein
MNSKYARASAGEAVSVGSLITPIDTSQFGVATDARLALASYYNISGVT